MSTLWISAFTASANKVIDRAAAVASAPVNASVGYKDLIKLLPDFVELMSQ